MKTIKFLTCLFFIFGITKSFSQQKKFELLSPNKEIKVSIALEDKIYYSISIENRNFRTKSEVNRNQNRTSKRNN